MDLKFYLKLDFIMAMLEVDKKELIFQLKKNLAMILISRLLIKVLMPLHGLVLQINWRTLTSSLLLVILQSIPISSCFRICY